MAQRYGSPIQHERMQHNLCPECGLPAAAHSSFVEFWLRDPMKCSLLPTGVEERIAQYVEDSAEAPR